MEKKIIIENENNKVITQKELQELNANPEVQVQVVQETEKEEKVRVLRRLME